MLSKFSASLLSKFSFKDIDSKRDSEGFIKIMGHKIMDAFGGLGFIHQRSEHARRGSVGREGSRTRLGRLYPTAW